MHVTLRTYLCAMKCMQLPGTYTEKGKCTLFFSNVVLDIGGMTQIRLFTCLAKFL